MLQTDKSTYGSFSSTPFRPRSTLCLFLIILFILFVRLVKQDVMESIDNVQDRAVVA